MMQLLKRKKNIHMISKFAQDYVFERRKDQNKVRKKRNHFIPKYV